MNFIKLVISLIVANSFLIFSVSASLNEPHQQIEDYRVLVNAIDWPDYLKKLPSLPSDEASRLLDVGCGTGRWLAAFQDKFGEQLKGIPLKCDLLDPSSVALQEAAQTLIPPLYLGELIQEFVQDRIFPPKSYDMIWAMHSFYSIPRGDLVPILQIFTDSLKEKGHLFIAQSSSKSFYIQSYAQLRAYFAFHQIESLTTAEMLLDAFTNLGLKFEIKVINYAEKVHVDDIQRLSHYVLNECIGYSFVRDNNITAGVEILDLLNHPKMGEFLRSFIVGDYYEFPQEIWLFIAKK